MCRYVIPLLNPRHGHAHDLFGGCYESASPRNVFTGFLRSCSADLVISEDGGCNNCYLIKNIFRACDTDAIKPKTGR